MTDKKTVEVVESYNRKDERDSSENIVVGEGGKFWMQGQLIGGVVVPGEPACILLTVKNHSTKKVSV